jgi:hypothetical protein
MSAPTLDRQPGSTQPGPSKGHRRQLLLVAAVVVLAIAVGTSLAIATRPVVRQDPVEAGTTTTADQNAAAGQDQTAEAENGTAQPPAADEATDNPTPGAASGAALADGDHPAYITKVDAANDRITVDVVQVFHDDAAVKAAIADGRSPSDAKYLTTWVRNENPRLRTLPLAGGLEIKLRDACGDPGNDRDALLTRLAANASQKGTYYYTLTVADGTVQRIQERLAVNAC